MQLQASSTKTTVNVAIKNYYGTDLVYPIDQTGKLLAQLTGKKTFTVCDIKLLKQLNYEFKVSQKTL